MPIAIGHQDDAYNYIVYGDDGSSVSLIKANVKLNPTWNELAALAGYQYLAASSAAVNATNAAGVAPTTVTDASTAIDTTALPTVQTETLTAVDQTP